MNNVFKFSHNCITKNILVTHQQFYNMNNSLINLFKKNH